MFIVCEHAASRQTGMRSTHIVSAGFGFSEVSSCTHSSAPAKPYFATIATPFRSLVLDFHPSTLRTFSGEPQVLAHASARPSATTFGSLPTLLVRCACTRPVPQPLMGFVVSVQLVVSTKFEVCPGSAGSPFPDWMLNHAILYVVVCAIALRGRRA